MMNGLLFVMKYALPEMQTKKLGYSTIYLKLQASSVIQAMAMAVTRSMFGKTEMEKSLQQKSDFKNLIKEENLCCTELV